MPQENGAVSPALAAGIDYHPTVNPHPRAQESQMTQPNPSRPSPTAEGDSHVSLLHRHPPGQQPQPKRSAPSCSTPAEPQTQRVSASPPHRAPSALRRPAGHRSSTQRRSRPIRRILAVLLLITLSAPPMPTVPVQAVVIDHVVSNRLLQPFFVFDKSAEQIFTQLDHGVTTHTAPRVASRLIGQTSRDSTRSSILLS